MNDYDQLRAILWMRQCNRWCYLAGLPLPYPWLR